MRSYEEIPQKQTIREMLNADGGENIYDEEMEHKMLSTDRASICMLKT